MTIAILGSGLMGRIMAVRLFENGFTDLTLIDKDDIDCSKSPAMIAAGMLSSLNESVMGGKLIYQLGKDSIKLWRKYLFNLGASHLLNDMGTILIASTKFNKEITHHLSKINFNTGLNVSYPLLNKADLKSLEPELDFKNAYFLPDEGLVNAKEVMDTMQEYLRTKINWRFNSEVTFINSLGQITVKGKNENFDLIIDCRGLGSRAIYPQLRGVRGEVIKVYAKEVNITRAVRLFHPRHNIYIVPLQENNYIIGATEIEALDYSNVSVRSALELLTSAYYIHSGFAEARIISLESSCRPTLIDNLPQIKIVDKLIAINGLYRHGFLLAPSIAEEVLTYLMYGKKCFSQIWS